MTITGNARSDDGRFFCPRCGSGVFGRNADEIKVSLGALDTPDPLLSTFELWMLRRKFWLPAFALALRFKQDHSDEIEPLRLCLLSQLPRITPVRSSNNLLVVNPLTVASDPILWKSSISAAAKAASQPLDGAVSDRL